jgi:hypothetical protein
MLLNLRRGGEGDAEWIEGGVGGDLQEELEEDEEEERGWMSGSWIANTAPAAFSLATDICPFFGGEAAEALPAVVRVLTSSEFFIDRDRADPGGSQWHAGEALLRAGLAELARLPSKAPGNGWSRGVLAWQCTLLADVTGQMQRLSSRASEKWLLDQESAKQMRRRVDQSELAAGLDESDKVDTPYGRGVLSERADDKVEVKLDWGATLHAGEGADVIGGQERHTGDVRWNALSDDEDEEASNFLDESLETVERAGGEPLTGPLCGRLSIMIALQRNLLDLLEGAGLVFDEDECKAVLNAAKTSAQASREALESKELMASLRLGSSSENWAKSEFGEEMSGGEGLLVAAVTGATAVEIRYLTVLVRSRGARQPQFAEAQLVATMKEVLHEYIEVDARRASRWSLASQHTNVMEVLRGMAGWTAAQQGKHKGELHGVLCDLVVVENRTIRGLLRDVLKGGV